MKNCHRIEICYPAFLGEKIFFGQRDFDFVWEVDGTMSHHSLLGKVFAAFNSGSGEECDVFLDSQIRSLSVGDFVAIDGSWYKCEPMGWTIVIRNRKSCPAEVKSLMKYKNPNITNGNNSGDVNVMRVHGHKVFHNWIDNVVSFEEKLSDAESVKIYNYMVDEGIID